MSDPFVIAACQYPIDFLESWQSFSLKIVRLVDEAASQHAKLLVFPEYASMELASLFDASIYSGLNKQLEALQTLLPEYLSLFDAQARKSRTHILAGSFPVLDKDGLYRNRAYLFGPDGLIGHQDKLQMTRFETESWNISPGGELALFDTALGKIAINICYDIEFPLIARKFVEDGAEIILVPSCTDALAGYYRVRTGCRARALENQCYVVQSPTVGNADWSEAVDINVGAAAIYTPMDHGFPADGVLDMGSLNEAQWVYGKIDLMNVKRIRQDGQVLVHRDWSRQADILALPTKTLKR